MPNINIFSKNTNLQNFCCIGTRNYADERVSWGNDMSLVVVVKNDLGQKWLWQGLASGENESLSLAICPQCLEEQKLDGKNFNYWSERRIFGQQNKNIFL